MSTPVGKAALLAALEKFVVANWPKIAGVATAQLITAGTVLAPILEPAAVALIAAVEKAQANTIAEGWHYEWDPENPGQPPHIVKGYPPVVQEGAP